MTTRETLTSKGLPTTPRLFGPQLYLAHEAGTDLQEMADMLEVSVDWVRERVEAARLCLEKQVQVIGPRPVDGRLRRTSAIYLIHPREPQLH